MTKKSFNFAEKHGMPLYFLSAADGTNVVKVIWNAYVHWWCTEHM